MARSKIDAPTGPTIKGQAFGVACRFVDEALALSREEQAEALRFAKILLEDRSVPARREPPR